MECIKRLEAIGVSTDDAMALRRIAMTLTRWHELECGDADGRAVERDEQTKLPYMTYDVGNNGKRLRMRIPDRETAALKRLAAIMQNYPRLVSHVQGDPRGASLYILSAADIPAGADIDAHYNRGVAVYK